MFEFLKKVPLFSEMPDEDFVRLCEMVEEVELPAGQQLFAEGSPGMRAYVIKEGELEIVKASAEREVLLAVRGSGEVIGEMSLLERQPRMASVRARTDTVMLAIHRDELDKLLNTSPSAARAMLHTILARWRNTEATLRQSEKLAQLGTLSAGVAHELNNPAAAVKRGASQLEDAAVRLGQAQVRLAALDLSQSQLETLNQLLDESKEQGQALANLSALERNDLEYELEDWLDEQGVAEPWEHAPALVNLGFTVERAQALLADFAEEHLPVVLDWLSTYHTVNSLLHEVHQGAGRISEIVKALKSYSYLDQAPVQEVDLHEGLDNTIVILRHKLKSLEVVRDYDPDLPHIQGYGSELNQVFTNILDNAADALEGASQDGSSPGQIIIRTRAVGETVLIEIEDNGPGIPDEVQQRIFEPFYTTKPPGKGTGLGLHISYNIVVVKHRGHLSVTSEPGKTVFEIKLPVNFEDVKPIKIDEAPPPARTRNDRLRYILQTYKTVAVVGMSTNPEKDAQTVPLYLKEQGYEIMPVNPRGGEIAGLRVYRDVFSLPKVPDVILVFRPSEEAMGIVEQAIQIGARVVWMQLGIKDDDAAAKARESGLTVVMNTCMRATHKRLIASQQAEDS